MRLQSPRLVSVLSTLLVALFRCLFWTVRTEFHLACPETNPYQPATRFFVYSVWHDSMLVPVFGGRQPATVALVGAHRDGSWVANVLRAVGIGSVRGSSSRGGARAARALINDTRGHHIVMTPDGPRGPRHELKDGLAFVASRTEKEVVPTAFSATRSWMFPGSWTDLMIPKPFSRVFLLTGEPVRIPPDADRETLERYTQMLQAEMDRLNEAARRLATGDVIEYPQAANDDEATSLSDNERLRKTG